MTPQLIIERAANAARKNKAFKALNRLENITSAGNYSEPGYSTNKQAILFGNWNKLNRWDDGMKQHITIEPDNKIWMRAVKALGLVAELEWEDEWTTCSCCGNAIRTQADSYGWTRSYHMAECEIICCECIPKQAAAVLEDYVADSRKAIAHSLGINPSNHGFVKVDMEFQNGLHPGQDSDPKKIAAALEKRGIDRYVFTLDSVGQFDATFSVWVDESQQHLVGNLSESETDGPSVSEALKRGLQSASVQMASLPDGSGIKYASIKPDGTADVRIVSEKEFIEGIKQ